MMLFWIKFGTIESLQKKFWDLEWFPFRKLSSKKLQVWKIVIQGIAVPEIGIGTLDLNRYIRYYTTYLQISVP